MPWGAIIAAILQIVGPLVKKWLEDWLANRLKDVAAKLAPAAGETEADTRALLTAVYKDIPWMQVARWRFVKRLLADIPPAVATGRKLTADQMAGIAAAAKAVG